MKYIVFIAMVFFVFGCTSKEMKHSMYDWYGFQNAQLNYSKNTDDKNALIRYEKELKKVLDQKKIPPSVCSEYALVLTKLGRKNEAKKYFIKEKTLYPESKVFIDNVLEKIYGTRY